MGCSCGRTGPFCTRTDSYARETIPARQCSSQFISGLLFALPLLNENSTLHGHGRAPIGTLRRHDGAGACGGGDFYKKGWPSLADRRRQRYAAPAVQTVEGDWSNAAFFLCMGALSETGVTVTGLNSTSLQADGLLQRFWCGSVQS